MMPTELSALTPAALAGAAALLAFALVTLAAWLIGRRRGGRSRERGSAALAMARRGTAPAEIARRTRLSRDAVGLALRLGTATERTPARQNSPAAAEAAAPRAAAARPRRSGGVLQAVMYQWVRVFAPLSARRARALPLGDGVQRSDPSYRQAA